MLRPAVLLPQVTDFGRRRLAGGIAHEPLLPGLEKLLAPPVGQIRIQAVATTEGRNALLVPQALEDNPDLCFGGESAAGLPPDVLDDLYSADFAVLMGTSSQGGKVSLISQLQLVHNGLNPHSKGVFPFYSLMPVSANWVDPTSSPELPQAVRFAVLARDGACARCGKGPKEVMLAVQKIVQSGCWVLDNAQALCQEHAAAQE